MAQQNYEYEEGKDFIKDFVFEYPPEFAYKLGGNIKKNILKEELIFPKRNHFLKEKFEFNRRLLNDPNRPLTIRPGDPDKEFKQELRRNIINLVKIINKDHTGSVLKDILEHFDSIRANKYIFTTSNKLINKKHDQEILCTCSWCINQNVCNKKLLGKGYEAKTKSDEYIEFKKKKFNIQLVDGLICAVKKKNDEIDKEINKIHLTKSKKYPDKKTIEENLIMKSNKFYKLLKYLKYVKNDLDKETITNQQFDKELQNLRKTYKEELIEAIKEIKDE